MSEHFPAPLLDDALRVQLEMRKLWEASGEPAGGWKIGFTTSDPRTPGDNRNMFPPEYRPFGFVLSNRILPSGSTVSRSAIKACQLEAELYVIMDAPLEGEVTPERARKAVREIGPSFEINEVRHVSRSTPLPIRIAGGLSNWGMVVGTGIAPPDWDVRTTKVTVVRNDDEPEVFEMPSGSFDDPFVSLTRLCRRLEVFGLGLREGDRVLTGAFSHHKVEAMEIWTANFAGIGEVQVGFSE